MNRKSLSIVLFAGLVIVGLQFKPFTMFALSGGKQQELSDQAMVKNFTQSLEVADTKTMSYAQPTVGRTTKAEPKQLRDYVLTLRNNSSKEILAYSIRCEKSADKTPVNDYFSFPYTGPRFLSATSHVKKITVPEGTSCRVSAIALSGLTYEGEADMGERMVAELRLTQNTFISLCQRLREMSLTPDGQYIEVLQSFVAELATKKDGKLTSQEAAQREGEIEAKRYVKSSVERAVHMENASVAKKSVADVVTKIEGLTKRISGE